MITIHEKNAQSFDTLGLGALLPGSCTVTEELNGSYELELSHPYDKEGKWKRIEKGRIIYASTPRGRQPFRIYRVKPDMSGIEVNAKHIFYDLLDNQCSAISFNGMASGALTAIQKAFTYAMPFSFDTDISISGTLTTGRMNPVQALLSDDDDITSFVKGFGGELLRDHFKVSVLKVMGQDRDVAIRYGKNLVGLEVTEDESDVKTRILCYGSDGSATLESPYISEYVYPKIYTLEDEDKTVAELKAEAQAILEGGADLPLINIKVDFIQLSKTAEYADYAPLEDVFLGDIVTVIHKKMGFAKKARVISYEWDCLLEQYDEVELGDFMPTLASAVTSGAKSGALASAASVTASAVSALLQDHLKDKNNPHAVTAAQTGGSGSSDESALPEVTDEDNGKVLMVEEGVWSACDLEVYLGEYEVTPTTEAIVLPTANLLMSKVVTVNAIPQSILNAEYQKGYDEAFELFKPYKLELPYIQSSGTQYIDTEFKPNQDTRVVMDVQMISENSSLAANEFFGARTSASSKTYAVQWNTSNDYFQEFYNNGYTNLDFGDNTIRQIIELNKNVISINGVVSERDYTAFQCEYTLFLFALNNAGSTSFFSNLNVYSCQIYDNDALIRDYIPVLDYDDVPCLYDKVNRKLYYNAGTGTFDYYIPVEFPTGYTQVLYIQSSGTQYIDTGFSAPSGFVSEFGMAVTDVSQIFYVVGSHNLTSPYGRNYIACRSNTAWELGLGDSYPSYSDDVPTNSMVLAKCSTVEGNSYLEVDGTRIISSTDNSGRSANNVWLFANQYDAKNGVYSVGRLYYMKIYTPSGTIVRDYIPCINASGVAGLYDLVNNKFYANAGTGAFIYA